MLLGVDMDFQRLVEIRDDFNLNQRDVAMILGVTQQTYSLWERGNKIIPLRQLNALCNYYGVSMDYILGLDNINCFAGILKELDKVIIGRRLKSFRLERGITQDEIAHMLNTTHSTISAYENGKTTILTAFAYEICKRYNISMDYLCGRVNKK